jgi:hypothetical protein
MVSRRIEGSYTMQLKKALCKSRGTGCQNKTFFKTLKTPLKAVTASRCVKLKPNGKH